MKVVIAGSRNIHDGEAHHITYIERLFDKFEEEYGEITLVVSGHARGPDRIGEIIAKKRGLQTAVFPAQWDLHGKAAGPIRNKEMAEFADAGIICWDGKSAGTKHMIDIMRKLNKHFILDIFEPVEYKYSHQPNGTIKVTTPDDIYINGVKLS